MLAAREVPLGGVRAMSVRRLLPQRDLPMVGAWCFLDRFGPQTTTMRVEPHPHIGLQTVTWPLIGEVHHRDTVGSDVVVRRGALNLMTSGEGIAHSEYSVGDDPIPLDALQLWVALPESRRHGAPDFEQHDNLPTIPLDTLAGATGEATVVLGTLAGATSPASTYTPIVGAEVRVPAGSRVRLPLEPTWEHALVGVAGRIVVSLDPVTGIGAEQMLYLGRARAEIVMEAETDAVVFLLGVHRSRTRSSCGGTSSPARTKRSWPRARPGRAARAASGTSSATATSASPRPPSPPCGCAAGSGASEAGRRYAGRVARPSFLSTRVLLICAAIGVATGLLGGVAGWLTPAVIAAVPIVYGLVLGVHVLPGIIAQEVLRLPWVALLAHVLGALVASAMAPGWAGRFLGTAILFGGIQELVAAATRYRVWRAWRFFISAVVIGILVAVVVAFVAHLSSLPVWAQIAYLAISVIGPVAWTAIGLGIGVQLRRAGIGTTAAAGAGRGGREEVRVGLVRARGIRPHARIHDRSRARLLAHARDTAAVGA